MQAGCKHDTLAELHDACSEAVQISRSEARRCCLFVRARCRELRASDTTGNLIDPPCDSWGGTRREFEAYLDEVIAKGAITMHVEGGWDGGDSMEELANDYQPMVDNWSVLAWAKP